MECCFEVHRLEWREADFSLCRARGPMLCVTFSEEYRHNIYESHRLLYAFQVYLGNCRRGPHARMYVRPRMNSESAVTCTLIWFAALVCKVGNCRCLNSDGEKKSLSFCLLSSCICCLCKLIASAEAIPEASRSNANTFFLWSCPQCITVSPS